MSPWTGDCCVFALKALHPRDPLILSKPEGSAPWLGLELVISGQREDRLYDPYPMYPQAVFKADFCLILYKISRPHNIPIGVCCNYPHFPS